MEFAKAAFACGTIGLPTKGARMERINLYDFYEIGRQVHPLADLYGDMKVGDVFVPLTEARDAIDRVLSGTPVKLGFCTAAATDVRQAIKFVWDAFFIDPQTKEFRYPEDRNTIVHNWYLHRLREAVKNFEAVFRAEMAALATYLVPKKPGQDMGDLVDRAHEMIPDEVREIVGSKVREEIQQAGRCKAFGLYTAAGYHVCRAVEAVTEVYYQLFSGQDGATRKSWDDYVKALQKIRESEAAMKPTERTMRCLLQMKDLDRNPLMHPRAVLDETAASLLFDLGKVTIIVMAQEMLEATGEPELPLPPPTTDELLGDLSKGIAKLIEKPS